MDYSSQKYHGAIGNGQHLDILIFHIGKFSHNKSNKGNMINIFKLGEMTYPYHQEAKHYLNSY